MTHDPGTSPRRSELHDALEIFLGEWRATGQSYGSPDQDADAPKARPEAWSSVHTTRWHTGGFFLVQDERARIGGAAGTVFDTLSWLGVEPDGEGYFAWTIDNSGYRRRYALARDGATWSLSGETERATTVFSDDLQRQSITWEWRVDGQWRPLCDRVAEKVPASGQ